MPKVMLIEDDATMLSLVSTLLDMEGFEVAAITKENSAEAVVETVRKVNPAVAMIDVHVRQISGLDVVRRMRQLAELNSVRVLMVSGMDWHDECLAAGADSFILKPFMPDDLIKRIAALANKK